jgi:dihydrofolate reductase
MGKVIVMEFSSLDGVIEDPDGRGGTPSGGWAFRYGPEAVAGDKFNLGPVLDSGVMVLGRRTWELFATIWPGRDDPFSRKMNAIDKLVVSRSLDKVESWEHCAVLTGDLAAEVRRLKQDRDVVVTGSLGVVDELRAHDLVDEYRLLVFPLVLGQGRRLFDQPGRPVDLDLVSAEGRGSAVRLVYGCKPAQ